MLSIDCTQNSDIPNSASSAVAARYQFISTGDNPVVSLAGAVLAAAGLLLVLSTRSKSAPQSALAQSVPG